MSISELSQQEIEVIKASIELRREFWQGNPELNAELDDLLDKIKYPFFRLKPIQRATLIGCIREYLIQPNEDLLKLTDLEILFTLESIEDRLRRVDIGLAAMNKLKNKKERNFRRFEDTLQRIGELKKAHKVFFSKTDNGKLYKIGIATKEGNGLRIEMDGSPISNIKFEKLNKDWFMDSASPKEVLDIMEKYHKENSPTDNDLQVGKILQETLKQ